MDYSTGRKIAGYKITPNYEEIKRLIDLNS